jgi:uncharacterized protein
MAASVLADTGALLALLDKKDQWHYASLEALAQLRVPLLTSEAVVTELFHLMGSGRFQMEAAWNLLRSGTILLAAINDTELEHIRALMIRYSDTPMDFADATLVYLAKRESISSVFTVNYDHFATYRIEGTRRFRILPGRTA